KGSCEQSCAAQATHRNTSTPSTMRIELRMFAPFLEFLPAGPDKVDISRGSANLQYRPAAVQTPLRGRGAGTPLATFAGDSNLGEIRADFVPVSQVDERPDGNTQIRGQIDGDVSRRGLEQGIGSLIARDEFGDDPTGCGLGLDCGHAVEGNAAAA